MEPDPRTAPAELGQEVLAATDATYESIRSFEAWVVGADVDLSAWDRNLAHLEHRRAKLSPKRQRAVLDAAVRTAAFNTGAIEGLHPSDRGLTITLASLAPAWQGEVKRVQGDETVALVTAAIDGYELALDLATQRAGLAQTVNDVAIRSMHERVCAAQETYTVVVPGGVQARELPKGVYKTQPNHVRLTDGSMHAYAPVDRTHEEVGRLVDQLRSQSFTEAHPVLQASYAHHALTSIHPFADGNGRVARVLASVYLFRAASIPLVVFADMRSVYFDALESADRGSTRPFTRFIRDRALDTMGIAAELLASAASPEPSAPAQIAAMLQTADERDGVAFAEEHVNRLAERLLVDATTEVGEALGELGVSGSARQCTEVGYPGSVLADDRTEGVRPIALWAFGGREITVRGAESVRLVLGAVITTDLSKPVVIRLDAVMLGEDGKALTPDETLEVRPAELDPTPSQALEIRRRTFAERIARRLVERL